MLQSCFTANYPTNLLWGFCSSGYAVYQYWQMSEAVKPEKGWPQVWLFYQQENKKPLISDSASCRCSSLAYCSTGVTYKHRQLYIPNSGFSLILPRQQNPEDYHRGVLRISQQDWRKCKSAFCAFLDVKRRICWLNLIKFYQLPQLWWTCWKAQILWICFYCSVHINKLKDACYCTSYSPY